MATMLWRLVTLWFRILTLRASHEDLASLGSTHLTAGAIATLLVGAGRYWDNPKATVLQHLGLGSLLYIVVLAALLYGAVKPLAPSNEFSFRNILAWLSLCSLPAAFYALPVERWTSTGTATSLNVAFLAVVAVWRILLLVEYLRLLARLSWVRIAVAALLPLTAIVSALALLNVEHAVFDLMSGTNRADPHGAAYFVVLVLAFGSIHIFPIALLGWLWIWYQDMRARRSHGNAAAEK